MDPANPASVVFEQAIPTPANDELMVCWGGTRTVYLVDGIQSFGQVAEVLDRLAEHMRNQP